MNKKRNGGARRDRTADLLRATQALSHLSYSPKFSDLVYVNGYYYITNYIP